MPNHTGSRLAFYVSYLPYYSFARLKLGMLLPRLVREDMRCLIGACSLGTVSFS